MFFMTPAQLVAQDTDSSYDVYDARVCGTADTQPCLPVTPPPPPACSGEGCRPPISSQQEFTTPASSTFSGPGDATTHGVLSATTRTPPKAETTRAARRSSLPR